jgi:hypothetical protein
MSFETVNAALVGPDSDSAGSAPSITGKDGGTEFQIGPQSVSVLPGRVGPGVSIASVATGTTPGVAVGLGVGFDPSSPWPLGP